MSAAQRQALRVWGAALSAGAGLVHGIAAPEHVREWWGYGLFFLLAAAAQFLYGIVLLVAPWRYDVTGALRPDGGRAVARAFYAGGIAINTAVVALYAVTRTVGIPFLGPAAGRVEPVTPLGLVSKAIEVALLAVLAVLLRRQRG